MICPYTRKPFQDSQVEIVNVTVQSKDDAAKGKTEMFDLKAGEKGAATLDVPGANAEVNVGKPVDIGNAAVGGTDGLVVPVQPPGPAGSANDVPPSQSAASVDLAELAMGNVARPPSNPSNRVVDDNNNQV